MPATNAKLSATSLMAAVVLAVKQTSCVARIDVEEAQHRGARSHQARPYWRRDGADARSAGCRRRSRGAGRGARAAASRRSSALPV